MLENLALLPENFSIHLIVRLPVKSGQRSHVEQAILSEVFANQAFFGKKV